MKFNPLILVFALLPLLSNCANADISRNREAYILSQPHGWIEITLTDSEIPPELPPRDLTEEQLRNFKPAPPTCYVSIELNNEIFLNEPIFPYGENEPYSVNTGFRFPAPIGIFQLDFRYSGCNIENGQEVTETFSSEITTYEKMVLPIIFDGNLFTVEPIEDNEVVTLEDIYSEIKKLK